MSASEGRTPQDTPRRAAALGYQRGRDSAPRVLAKGGGDVAEQILARAKEHDIPVAQDPDLLQCLAPMQVGESIPLEAYVAVAEILAFLDERNK